MHTGQLHDGIRSLRRAIELNPGLALAHSMLARALSSFERHEEAIAAAQKSVTLDPLGSWLIHTVLGDSYYFARQYEKAVLTYRMSIELDPRFDGAHTDLARSLEALGRFDEARAAYETGRTLAGGVAGPSFGLAHLEAAAGNVDEARRILAELTAARSSRVSSRPGASAPCTRVLAMWTRRSAGSRSRCRKKRPASSCCACIRGWIRFDRTRATGRSSSASGWTTPLLPERDLSQERVKAHHMAVCQRRTAGVGSRHHPGKRSRREKVSTGRIRVSVVVRAPHRRSKRCGGTVVSVSRAQWLRH